MPFADRISSKKRFTTQDTDGAESEMGREPKAIRNLRRPYGGYFSKHFSVPSVLKGLQTNSKTVIPRAGFARGICFFSSNREKQIPRFARDDN